MNNTRNGFISGLAALKRDALQFLFATRDATPMRMFELVFTVSFLLWAAREFAEWQDWLTGAGLHLTAAEAARTGLPAPWPLLEAWQVPFFACAILLGSALVCWPLATSGDARLFGTPGGRRAGMVVLFFCALYGQRVDFAITSSANRMFVSVYAILALAPGMVRCPRTGHLMQPVTAQRVLQATLVLMYFASGLAKMDGDWLTSPDVLWSQVQGKLRTDTAAWCLRIFPLWVWTGMQYATLIFEVGAPVLFVIKPLRSVALVLGILMHGLIALMMNDLVYFSAPMLAFFALFVSAETWRNWRGGKKQQPFDNAPDAPPETGSPDGDHFWLARLGGWQADLLCRCLGLLFYMTLLGHMAKRSMADFLAAYPLSLLLLGICGLGLMLLGSRVLLIVAAFLAGADFFVKVLYGEGGAGLRQQAAEYPFFVILPLALTVLAFLAWKDAGNVSVQDANPRWKRFQNIWEESVVKTFRWTLLTTLFFVSFHKFNTDFFDPAVSCEGVLKRNFLSKTWDLAWFKTVAEFSSPPWVVLFEGPVCLFLLVWFRRLGVVATASIYGFISFCDALVVTLCVIVPTLVFLTEDDRILARKHWRLLAIIWAGILAVWLPISCACYLGARPWFQPALYQAVILGLMVLAGGIQVIAGVKAFRGGGVQAWREWSGFGIASLIPAKSASGRFVWAVVLFWIFNGFSPYLGVKFNYSFAMLSNLRVDDGRWNHFLVPKWVRITKHDGYFHVLEARLKFGNAGDASKKRRHRFAPGLYSPQAFHEMIADLKTVKGAVEVVLLLEHKEDSYDFQGTLNSDEFRTFMTQLPPPSGHWLHDRLPAGEAPMGCKH